MHASHFFRVLFSVSFIVLSSSIYGLSHLQENSYLSHLSEVNKEWFHHPDVAPIGNVSFQSDRDRIQLHLNLVIAHLQSNAPQSFSPGQLANRKHLLEGLQEYADRKIFPINKYHAVRQPYFVDDVGTNCAVGQMIFLSGRQDLVDRIRAEHNYDYIKDIKTPGLEEWALDNGFTIDELKWIQPVYPPEASYARMNGGTNGTVNHLKRNDYEQSLIIAGSFTELDSLPCLNIGTYKDQQLSCLGQGIDGEIHEVLAISGEMYAFGELQHDGEIFSAAKFNGTTWEFFSIPGREGAICTAAYNQFWSNLEIVIQPSTSSKYQEIWQLSDNDTWVRKAQVNGVVLDIAELYDEGVFYVGHFDTAIIHDANGTKDSLVTNNVLARTPIDSWFGVASPVSDTINCAILVGNTLIFGGTSSQEAGSSKVCLSRYLNKSVQSLFLLPDSVQSMSVEAMVHTGGSSIVLGGDLDLYHLLGMYYGENLASFDLALNYIEPIALLDNTVHSLAYFNNELFVGGSFHSDHKTSDLNFLVRKLNIVGIENLSDSEQIRIYPQPATQQITIQGVNSNTAWRFISATGQLVKSGQGNNVNVEPYPRGLYILEIEGEHPSSHKVILE